MGSDDYCVLEIDAEDIAGMSDEDAENYMCRRKRESYYPKLEGGRKALESRN